MAGKATALIPACLPLWGACVGTVSECLSLRLLQLLQSQQGSLTMKESSGAVQHHLGPDPGSLGGDKERDR